MTPYTFVLQALRYKAFFQRGVARPLSPLRWRRTDTFPRVTQVYWRLLPKDSARDWHRPPTEVLSFPRSRLSCCSAPALFSAESTSVCFYAIAIPTKLGLVGEQSNAYRILLRYDRKSRHRRIKKQRRYERLAATSQLSLWYGCTPALLQQRPLGLWVG